MKNKKDWFAEYIKIIQTMFVAVVFCIFVFFVLGQAILPDERDESAKNCEFFQDDWYWVKNDGERIPVEVPGSVEAEWGEATVLVKELPDDVKNGDNLCFRTVWQNAEIYIGGELRKAYNTKDSRPFGTNSALRYIFVELTDADAGKEIEYHVSSNSKYAGQIFNIYIGDEADIWVYLMGKTGGFTLISLFLFLLSFFCIAVCFILKYVYKKKIALGNLAWAIFFCSLWMLSEMECRQIVIKNVSVLSNFTYWSLMLIPFPMSLYMNEIQEGRYRKVYAVPMTYAAIMLVVGTALQIFDVVQFVQQLPYIHIGIGVCILLIIATITIDIFKKKFGGYAFVGIGVYGLLFTAVLEILLYYNNNQHSLGTVLALGLLFLLAMAVIKTGQDLFVSEKKKQQAITAKEEQAKFLANMSHEIRTPINVVIGMNEMILRESHNETVRGYSHNIQNASTMLLGLVNDVLDFSKIESGQLELVEDNYNLAELVQDEVLILNTRTSGKNISTRMDIDTNVPAKLFGDELRIKQILTNLLSNAVKYTKEGNVTLKLFYKKISAEEILLCFSVIDTGVGIKKEDLTELFDSFKRLELSKNRNIEGTGLGLNIVKKLVDLMGGDITVDSVYGKGSNFTVCIPQKVVDSTPMGPLSAYEPQAEEDKKEEFLFTAPGARVLVVDDNFMNLSLMKELLKRTRVTVDLAKSGMECLKKTEENFYHLILLDHMMPEMDGIETLSKLRASRTNPNCNAKVIALTANAVAGCREMYLSHGFDDYFSKPIEVNKLDELLIQYLPESLVRREAKITGEKAQNKPEQPKEIDKKQVVETGVKNMNISLDALLFIDKKIGLSYCMDSEDIYYDILPVFASQCEEYVPELDKCYQEKNWKQYATIAHALKGNSLNIGACNFSKFSLQHEMAAKEGNEVYIVENYELYIAAMKGLMEKIKAN